ncbi:hypothetical protein OROHE_021268 [Orobanche hederae]
MTRVYSLMLVLGLLLLTTPFLALGVDDLAPSPHNHHHHHHAPSPHGGHHHHAPPPHDGHHHHGGHHVHPPAQAPSPSAN